VRHPSPRKPIGAGEKILETQNLKEKIMTTVTYSVPNISCGHCVHTIQTELADVAGVQTVKASQDTRKVEIVFEAPASEEKIKALLAEINYPVAA
jgi:copper chaperone